MVTEAERISRLEGAYTHLAAKEDLANLKADLRADLNKMFVAFTTLMLIGLGAVATIMEFRG